MKKIMFICTGNVCRSAMAEGYMRKKIKDENLDLEACSSGLYAQDGAEATYLAKVAMKEYDVDITAHRATSIYNAKVRDMDILLCATVSHKRILYQMYPELAEKIFTIKEFAYGENIKDKDINDPWGYDITVYKHCAKELVDSINMIVNKLKNDNE